MPLDFKDIAEPFGHMLHPEHIHARSMQVELLQQYLQSKMAALRLHAAISPSPDTVPTETLPDPLTGEERKWIQGVLIDNVPQILKNIDSRIAEYLHSFDKLAKQGNMPASFMAYEEFSLTEAMKITLKELRNKALNILRPNFEEIKDHFANICNTENTWIHTVHDINLAAMSSLVAQVLNDVYTKKEVPKDIRDWLQDFYFTKGPFLHQQTQYEQSMMELRAENEEEDSEKVFLLRSFRKSWIEFDRAVQYIQEKIEIIMSTLVSRDFPDSVPQ